jgi:hypothetical protein
MNYKKNYRKYANPWRLNNSLLNYPQWDIEEISGEMKKFLESNRK